MFSLPFILAAGSLPLVFGAPVPSNHSVSADVRSSHILSGRAGNAYQTTFGGDGEGKDWPKDTNWLSFNELWQRSQEMMTSSCPNTDAEPTTESEAKIMRGSIEKAAKSTGVDERVILEIIMQESNGCVRIKTTNNGVNNPGLMQSYNGKGSCNPDGNPITPCPPKTINTMVLEGAEHFKSCMSAVGGSGAAQIYKAARKYNSGSVDTKNLGDGLGSTACYVSDIVNRLLGWSSGASQCTESVTTLTGSSWSGSSDSGSSGDDSSSSGDSSGSSAGDSAASTPAASPAPTENTAWTAPAQSSSEPVAPGPTSTTSPVAPVQPAWTPSAQSVPAVPAPTQTQTPSPVQQDGSWTNPSPSAVQQNNNWANPSPSAAPSAVPSAVPSAIPSAVPSAVPSTPSGAPLYPGAIASCQQYNTIVDGDFCIKVNEKYGIPEWQLRNWNSGLDEKCTNLWLGYQYCVKA